MAQESPAGSGSALKHPIEVSPRPISTPIETALDRASLLTFARVSSAPVLAAAGVLVYSHALPRIGLPGAGDIIMLTVFASAMVSSIAGFAFSAVCGAVLFHLHLGQVTVVQTMMVCSTATQAYMVATLWRDIQWRAFMPFLIGGTVGLPLGLEILLHTNRTVFMHIIGALLCLYTLYMLFRKPIILPRPSRIYDGVVGFVGGVTGGAAAVPGLPVTVWGQMFGWNRDYQRCIYQPFILVMQVLGLFGMCGFGKAAPGVFELLTAILTIPAALGGTMIGLSWYRRFNDQQFLLAVNLLLLVSGATLLI